jgi:predicted  nucleic acid-binding Zn-ribbon protein|eukprot:TRINITY_DN49940_c0_g1_i1.p1 TRINITY_DN49940_c0_g1~~TRINITY_DN49940_c0_g1_i1.p1  ORF type:complete len:353 (-),score=70.26 TRINITY_DN49940_c0_g1_i1:207-1265(-)
MAQQTNLGDFDSMGSQHRLPPVQDLDVTVLAFAQWLSEMRSRSNASLQQMLAEMGIIRNGITSNNTDLTEFKRNTATVQQQMQSQISDLRDKLTDAYTEISNIKKTKSQFEQEVHAEYQSLSEQLQFKTLELETLKKGYTHNHQQVQQQLIQLQTEVNELRIRSDDNHRSATMATEQHHGKVGELEMASQYSTNELKRLRSDHDQAISNLAENMNRWNDTLRDLSKEFHNFQKVMNVNQQRIQSNLWDVQAAHHKQTGVSTLVQGDGGTRLETSSDAGVQKSPQPGRQQVGSGALPLGAMSSASAGQSTLRAQSPGAGGVRRVPAPAAGHPLVPPYAPAPQQASHPSMYQVM